MIYFLRESACHRRGRQSEANGRGLSANANVRTDGGEETGDSPDARIVTPTIRREPITYPLIAISRTPSPVEPAALPRGVRYADCAANAQYKSRACVAIGPTGKVRDS